MGELVVLEMNLEVLIGFQKASDLIIKGIQQVWTAWEKVWEQSGKQQIIHFDQNQI